MYLSLITGVILYICYNIALTNTSVENIDKILINLISAANCYFVSWYLTLYFYNNETITEYKDYCIIVGNIYYTYDAIRMINSKLTKSRVVLICHHIFAMYVLNNGYQYVYILFYLAECSMLFHYPVYYLKKTNSNYTNLLSTFQYLQAVTYIPIRCFAFLYVYYLSFFTHSLYINLIALPIYLMGLIWSYKLYKDCKKIS